MFGKLIMKPRSFKNRRQRAAASMDLTAARPWSDLPADLLSLIANRLSITQLLAFRGVCKSWRSGSITASAYPESSENTKPSLIVYDEQNNKCSLWYRTDKDAPEEGKMYELNIPELENATCLASKQGWLLLYQQGSMFFFCPFSRTRIDLPELPESDLANHVAAFSAPPTSKECIVSVAERCSSTGVKLYVLQRGDQAWTKHDRKSPRGFLGTISAAVYVGEKSSFYFMDDNNKMLKFSVNEKTWYSYVIARQSTDKSIEMMPFDYRLNYFNACNMKSWMGLQDDASISICGTLLPGQKHDTYACNENMEAPNGNANSKLKGIWIEPRFFQVPANQGWSL